MKKITVMLFAVVGLGIMCSKRQMHDAGKPVDCVVCLSVKGSETYINKIRMDNKQIYILGRSKKGKKICDLKSPGHGPWVTFREEEIYTGPGDVSVEPRYSTLWLLNINTGEKTAVCDMVPITYYANTNIWVNSGHEILYFGNRKNQSGVYSFDVQSRTTRLLFRADMTPCPCIAYSPSLKCIAFSHDLGTIFIDIVRVGDTLPYKKYQISDCGLIYDIEWLSDQKILFSTDDALELIDLTNGAVDVVYDTIYIEDFFISQDHQSLIFIDYLDYPHTQLQKIYIYEKRMEKVIDLPVCYSPRWLPNEQGIILAADDDTLDQWQIGLYMIDKDGNLKGIIRDKKVRYFNPIYVEFDK